MYLVPEQLELPFDPEEWLACETGLTIEEAGLALTLVAIDQLAAEVDLVGLLRIQCAARRRVAALEATASGE